MNTNLNNISAAWLSDYECQDCDQHCCSAKPTCTILKCPWKRHFMAHSLTW